jgi:8-oxo-dGTP pyrophosphatase MutT (NUDIX family)
MKRAVLFIFYDPKAHKVLSEQRLPDHHTFPNLKTFPTGSVEDGESIEEGLFREAKEEFGIVPTVYEALPPLEGHGAMLHPFWMKEWEGELPSAVLDKGSKLIWETFEEASSSPVKTRKKVIALLENSISKSHL